MLLATLFLLAGCGGTEAVPTTVTVATRATTTTEPSGRTLPPELTAPPTTAPPAPTQRVLVWYPHSDGRYVAPEAIDVTDSTGLLELLSSEPVSDELTITVELHTVIQSADDDVITFFFTPPIENEINRQALVRTVIEHGFTKVFVDGHRVEPDPALVAPLTVEDPAPWQRFEQIVTVGGTVRGQGDVTARLAALDGTIIDEVTATVKGGRYAARLDGGVVPSDRTVTLEVTGAGLVQRMPLAHHRRR